MADWGFLLPLAIVAAGAGTIGLDRWPGLDARWRPWLGWGLALLQALPFVALALLCLTVDRSYLLVWQSVTTEMPVRYRVAGLWSGRGGPLVMWAALMALVVGFGQARAEGESAAQQRVRGRLGHGVTLLLLLVAAGLEPFQRSTAQQQASVTGGMNPLLQTDLMVIHPPLVFLFYSIALATSIHVLARILSPGGDDSTLGRRLTPSARLSLVVGTIAIGLGGLWAYLVLDWGGYWAWDPVETGSFLPWVALVVLLHLRVKPGRQANRWWLLMGLLPGLLSLNATLVTRAGGVWASVHAFVGDGTGTPPPSAWARLMLIRDDATAGAEVTTYLVAMLVSVGVVVGWLVWRALREDEPDRSWQQMAYGTFALVGVAALGAFVEPTAAPLQVAPGWLLVAACWFPVWAALVRCRAEVTERVTSDRIRLAPLVAASLMWLVLLVNEPDDQSTTYAIWLDHLQSIDPTVVALTMLIGLLALVEARSPSGWHVAGVLILIFAAWSGTQVELENLLPVAILLLGVLLPWLLAPDDEAEGEAATTDDASTETAAAVTAAPAPPTAAASAAPAPPADPFSLARWSTRRWQQFLALSTPSVVGGAFLALTWIVLLGSIDGARFGEHEVLGAPLILLALVGLTTYAWRHRLPPQRLFTAIVGALALGVVLALSLPTMLPGDAGDPLLGPVDRGHVAWFLLPLALLALPALVLQAWDRLASGQRHWRRRRGEARVRARRRARGALGPHLAHIGLVVLLLGHIFASTLVARGDISHTVSLTKDRPVTIGDHQLVFRELTTMSSDHPDFDQRFDVGDGFIAAIIEIRDADGNHLGELEPGVLRFDTKTANGTVVSSFPRSEVARLSGMDGDLILIFDFSQAQGLGSVMDDPSVVQRVRLTVYDLPGSHLVWAGWSLLIIGMGLSWSANWRPARSGDADGSDDGHEHVHVELDRTPLEAPVPVLERAEGGA